MKPSIDSAAPGSAAYKRRRRGAGPAVRERLRDGSGRVRFGWVGSGLVSEGLLLESESEVSV